jgi:hypothetical protein
MRVRLIRNLKPDDVKRFRLDRGIEGDIIDVPDEEADELIMDGLAIATSLTRLSPTNPPTRNEG